MASGTPALRGQLPVAQPQRHHDRAVGFVPSGKRRHMAVTLIGCLDVVHHGVETLVVEHADGPGQAGGHRGTGQEGHEDDDGASLSS
jgi:hypothetical protein